MNLWNTLYAWACQRLYHELAPAYDLVAWLVSAGQWARWRRLALDELTGDEARVLELGFGTGALLAEMARRDVAQPKTIIGLELSTAMQRVTDRRLRSQRLSTSDVPRLQASALAIPLADASIDAILSTFPAPYILHPATLAECVRVLRPGGRLVIVGLWTRLENQRLARRLPLFYGAPSKARLDSVEERLAGVGFAISVDERTINGVAVGIITATKT